MSPLFVFLSTEKLFVEAEMKGMKESLEGGRKRGDREGRGQDGRIGEG